jgi:nucleoside 2-deoxyribosyltransferase
MEEKTKIKIYLAGPFTNPDWRDLVIKKAPQHIYLDPRKNEQSACVTVTRDDLINGVESSDIVFAYFPKGSQDTGACIEIGDGFGKRKLIVIVNENLFLHPLISGIAKRQFSSLEASIIYLNNLKSIEQLEEFASIYKTIKDLSNIL